MNRFFQYRFIVIRYIILWIFISIMFKVIFIFYYDLHQRSIVKSSPPSTIGITKDNKQYLNSSSSSAIRTFKPVNLSVITNDTNIKYYRQYVKNKNDEQFMYNNNLFFATATRYILLVQVHKRIVYLKKFIQMLQAVEAINQSLVIFSHDFIDSDINTLVTNIKFVPVKNI